MKNLLSLKMAILLGTLSLGGCSAPLDTVTPASPMQPQPTHISGGVIVTFSGVSSGVLKASANPVLSSNLAAQTLSSPPAISYTPLAQSSFTLDGFRYLSATFRVTPDVYATNLSFVAQVKRGLTIADTAVLNLKKFDGTTLPDAVAQNLARAVRPINDVRRGVSGLLVNPESADFQVWSETELSTYSVAPDSYLLPYGFVARSETRTGRDLYRETPGVVTFAVSMPLQSDPQNNPYSFSMYFESLSDSETRVTQSPLTRESDPGFFARVAQAGANKINIFTRPYESNTPFRLFCNVRIAGSSDKVLEQLLPPSITLVQVKPAPNSESIPVNSALELTLDSPSGVYSISPLKLISNLRGFLRYTTTLPGPTTWVQPFPPLLPNEIANVSLGGTVCAGNGYRLRAAAIGNGTFGSSVTYPVSDPAAEIITADFNRDGKLDQAVLTTSGQVNILFGLGDGTFGSSVAYGVSGTTHGIATANFAGGNLDLVVASDNKVKLLAGTSGGTFGASVPYTVSGIANGVTTDDLNGDGWPDVAVATSDSKVNVIFGTTEGTLGTSTAYTVSGSANSVSTGDFNGDGQIDLAVATADSRVNILLSEGGSFGSSTSYTVSGAARRVISGDFDGDAKLDLAVIADDKVNILLGSGDGTFGSSVLYTVSGVASGLITGDFDGDGKLDLAVATLDGKVNILLNQGNGTFGASGVKGVSAASYSVTTGDFNGDSRLDLALTTSDGKVNVLLANSSPTATNLKSLSSKLPLKLTSANPLFSRVSFPPRNTDENSRYQR